MLSRRRNHEKPEKCPLPSLGADEGTTNSRYLVLVKNVFRQKARKGGSGINDIFRKVRTKCQGSNKCVYKAVQKAVKRLFRAGYIYQHDAAKRRFKLTSKGKAMLYQGQRRNVCNYRPKKRKRPQQVCKYRPRRRKAPKKRQICRYRPQKKRKSNYCRYRPRRRR